jgi:hypothetical protein
MTTERDVIFKLALPKPAVVKVVQITTDCIELQIDNLAIRFSAEIKGTAPIKMFIPSGA